MDEGATPQPDLSKQPGFDTLKGPASSGFFNHANRLRVVGCLDPVNVKIERVILPDELLIGRDERGGMRVDANGLRIDDNIVSRRHASLYRKGNDFILKDLGSANGTYVDGVPIVSCVLHNGDLIQFGRSLFLFDRLLEYVNAEGGAAR